MCVRAVILNLFLLVWKRQVEEESVKVGLRREDALCRSKWSVGVN